MKFLNLQDRSRIDSEIKKKDDELSKKLNLDVEPIKKELNRIIGREIENSTDKNVDFEKQDIVINVDLRKDLNVRIQINPLFIEGKYNKFVRNIPQTKWPCGVCKGKGCEACNFTGKQYSESVEELISKHILETRPFKSFGFVTAFYFFFGIQSQVFARQDGRYGFRIRCFIVVTLFHKGRIGLLQRACVIAFVAAL